MSSKKVRSLFKFGRAKSQSTTDLSEWSKSDEKLMKAVEAGDAKKVSSILSKKAMVPSKLGPRGHSIFHVACALGNAQIVDLLLKETDDVNDLTIQGNTCLQLSAAKGHEQVVQRLLQSGAEVDMRDSNDMTALHHACAGLHYGCVHALLQGGANPTCIEMGGKTPLFYAAHRGEISICKLLVDKGADVNAADKMLITPLMVAAREGNREAVEFLLKRGANPNTADREGHMALYYAMAAGHPELREVFANAPLQASWDLRSPDRATTDKGREETGDENGVTQHRHSTQHTRSASSEGLRADSGTVEELAATQSPNDAVHSLAGTDMEAVSQSEDESPALHRVSLPPPQPAPQANKDTQAYKELEAEHEQLSDEYHTLSIENLRLRDKVEYMQQQMNGKHQQLSQQIRSLKQLLEEEKERSKDLESRVSLTTSQDTPAPEVGGDGDTWHDSDEDDAGDASGKKTKGGKNMNDKQMVALLRSQILTLRQENDQLRNNAQALHNGYQESSQSQQQTGKVTPDSTDGQDKLAAVEAEKQLLKAEILKLKESAESHELSQALGQEEIIVNNTKLQSELETLRETLTAVQGEKMALQEQVTALEAEKAALPSDKVAVLNSAKVMEEVKFDEEGFVEGQDLTKEEFLQAQNEQLKVQCGLLTEELSKLRVTFDAILKAGDNLQADYDQLQSQKDTLHDQLEVVLKEKEEVVTENEFLLSDGNALHEDLKKLVSELEKMQDKYRKVCADKEQLQHQHNAINIAGKVGEVSRLLEEKEKLQARLVEAEETSARLTHDQAILLEEVQSQQERVTALITQRDSLQAEVDDAEALVGQNEALTQEYAQLELDFNELLKEKERLEASLPSGSTTPPASSQAPQSPDITAMSEERDLLIAERDQLELTIKELSRENAALEEEVETLRTRVAESSEAGFTSPQLHSAVQELTREKGELEEELANMQDQMADLETQLSAQQDGLEEGDVDMWKASVAQLEATVSELSRENASLEEELEGVKVQLDRSQEALENRLLLEGMSTSTRDSTIAKLQQEKLSLVATVEELKQRLSQSSVNGEIEPASSSSGDSEVQHLCSTIARLQDENTRLLSEIDSLQDKLVRLTDHSAHTEKGSPLNGVVGEGEVSKGSEHRHKVRQLEDQVSQLQQQLTDLDQLHTDTINTYRTHLLSAVQGHMDAEVKEALHSIIEMRSMEQFC